MSLNQFLVAVISIWLTVDKLIIVLFSEIAMNNYPQERCFHAVIDHFRSEKKPGLRRSTEKLIAMMIASGADDAGYLPNFDVAGAAQISRLSLPTFRRYLNALINRGWLVKYIDRAEVKFKIDPNWLSQCPPRFPELTDTQVTAASSCIPKKTC